MSSTPASTDISSEVSKLSITTPNPKKTTTEGKPKKKEVADSWEDEDVSSSSDTETKGDCPTRFSQGHRQGVEAPPPTPISPTVYDQACASTTAPEAHRTTSDASGSSAARPEKTDAVARRMITGALGLKAPKMTDEQRAYQKAIREKERKRREEQKAAEKKREEDAAKAKAAMWDD